MSAARHYWYDVCRSTGAVVDAIAIKRDGSIKLRARLEAGDRVGSVDPDHHWPLIGQSLRDLERCAIAEGGSICLRFEIARFGFESKALLFESPLPGLLHELAVPVAIDAVVDKLLADEL